MRMTAEERNNAGGDEEQRSMWSGFAGEGATHARTPELEEQEFKNHL